MHNVAPCATIQPRLEIFVDSLVPGGQTEVVDGFLRGGDAATKPFAKAANAGHWKIGGTVYPAILLLTDLVKSIKSLENEPPLHCCNWAPPIFPS